MKTTKVEKRARKTNIAENGITLVALVVTIIILLILAGVTLNLVLSNNGLIGRAKQGVAKYQEASQNEQVDLNLMGDLIDEASGVKKITVGGSNIQVTPGVESLKEHYGEEVTSFSSVEGVKWQLFYDDADNYYLIASDYVPIDTLPNELYKETQAEGETKYSAWFATWDSSSSSYKGPIVETGEWSKGTASNTIPYSPLKAATA